MSNWHTPKKPTEEQLADMKDRFEIKGKGLLVKRKYIHSPAVGQPAGGVGSRGYLVVKLLGRLFLVHHMVWYLTHGQWPEQPLDHIDGDKLNNTPDNLRLSDGSHNGKAYAKTYGAVGYRGASFHKSSGKYQARAVANGKLVHIGYYDTAEEAAIARDLKCYKELGYPWEGLNEIGQEYILKHHPEWLDE